jgi:phage terminase large subunit-like protein
MQATAERIRQLAPEDRRAILGELSDVERATLFYSWDFWARESQRPPEQWGRDGCYMWIIRAGRGWGKTRTGAQTFINKIVNEGYKFTSLCAATSSETRDIQVKGESGILACCPPWFRPEYRPSEKKLLWPNGAVTSFFYGSEPELSRGAQSDLIWFDEIAKYQYPEETFDNLILGLRLGRSPLAVITSTPKPTRFCREIENKKNLDGRPAAVVTIGSTFENKDNLSPIFYDSIVSRYKGTRLGEQELNAVILDDNPNALFKREILARDTVNELPPAHKVRRIVIAVDPAVSSNETSNLTGVIAVYEAAAPDTLQSGTDVQNKGMKHFYIAEDASLIGRPHEWAAAVKRMEEKYSPGSIVYESNQGGEMIGAVLQSGGIRTRLVPVRAVVDKEKRAMPVSLISNQGRFHIVRGNLAAPDNLDALIDELTSWIPGEDSPDRLDACIHAVNYLEGSGGGGVSFAEIIGV